MTEDERKLLQERGYRWQLVSPDGEVVSIHEALEKIQAEEEAPEHHALISDDEFPSGPPWKR
jgi:hypothetical protein